MKRIVAVLLSILMLASVSACSANQNPESYTTTVDGITYEVDTENCRIFDGENSYDYVIEGNADDYILKITYPDNSEYSVEVHNAGDTTSSSATNNYVGDDNADGETLCRVLSKVTSSLNPSKNVLLIVLLFIVGLISIIKPNVLWYCSYGWMIKDAEPSDIAMTIYRVMGVVLIVVGVALIII